MGQRVLLLEDNPADVRLMQEAFSEIHSGSEIDVVMSQKQAIEYFTAVLEGAPAPSLAILDINLPAGSGIDVLKFIRGQHSFQSMPILMLTTSDNQQDIRAAKEHGATTYYVKPDNLDGFLALVAELQAFWLERTEQ